MIQEAYRAHMGMSFGFSLMALLGCSWALWRQVSAYRKEGRKGRWLASSSLAFLFLASAYCTPFVSIPVAYSYMGSARDKALEFVGAPTGSLIAACGEPESVSEWWLVYQPPWFLLWPVDLRVLVAKDIVLTAYLDD